MYYCVLMYIVYRYNVLVYNVSVYYLLMYIVYYLYSVHCICILMYIVSVYYLLMYIVSVYYLLMYIVSVYYLLMCIVYIVFHNLTQSLPQYTIIYRCYNNNYVMLQILYDIKTKSFSHALHVVVCSNAYTDMYTCYHAPLSSNIC